MAQPEQQGGLSSGSRWAIGIVGVVALIVAFFVLRGGGDGNGNGSGTSSNAAGTTTQQTSTGAGQTTATTRGQTTTDDHGGGGGSTDTSGSTSTSTDAAPTAPAAPVIRVVNGKPAGGVQKISVKKGGRLRFVVQSDAPVPIHLHGYDVEKQAAPGKPAVFDVPATIEGRFEAEVESTSTQIAQIDVTPS